MNKNTHWRERMFNPLIFQQQTGQTGMSVLPF